MILKGDLVGKCKIFKMCLRIVLIFVSLSLFDKTIASICRDPYETSLAEPWLEFCFSATKSMIAFPDGYKNKGEYS